ncbi:hypothetical protein [Orbus mooreae]|uniref:hypothetical protein n=1 Tax=Orbus mooreae TaxID=3074107 RepID=UPI00370DA5D8
MKKSYYVFLSVLIFLIISPFFNGLFSYIFINFSSNNNTLGAEDFSFLIFIAYIVTFIPALCNGFLYGFLSPKRTKLILRWFIPMLGCVIYFIYIFILQILFALFRGEEAYMMIIFSLLSIGGSFFSTVIANISLRDKIA